MVLHSDRCFNPFRKVGEKGHIGKGLRTVSNRILAHNPDLPENSKICFACAKKFKIHFEENIQVMDKTNDVDNAKNNRIINNTNELNHTSKMDQNIIESK